MRIGLSPRQARGFLSAVLIAATPPLFVSGAAFAAPQDRYYERAFVLAANDRCGLFEPQLTAALTAAAYQARGAALRAHAVYSQIALHAEYGGVVPELASRDHVRKLLPLQPGDVPDTFADVSALQRDVGYAPSTTIQTGKPPHGDSTKLTRSDHRNQPGSHHQPPHQTTQKPIQTIRRSQPPSGSPPDSTHQQSPSQTRT